MPQPSSQVVMCSVWCGSPGVCCHAVHLACSGSDAFPAHPLLHRLLQTVDLCRLYLPNSLSLWAPAGFTQRSTLSRAWREGEKESRDFFFLFGYFLALFLIGLCPTLAGHLDSLWPRLSSDRQALQF